MSEQQQRQTLVNQQTLHLCKLIFKDAWKQRKQQAAFVKHTRKRWWRWAISYCLLQSLISILASRAEFVWPAQTATVHASHESCESLQLQTPQTWLDTMVWNSGFSDSCTFEIKDSERKLLTFASERTSTWAQCRTMSGLQLFTTAGYKSTSFLYSWCLQHMFPHKYLSCQVTFIRNTIYDTPQAI